MKAVRAGPRGLLSTGSPRPGVKVLLRTASILRIYLDEVKEKQIATIYEYIAVGWTPRSTKLSNESGALVRPSHLIKYANAFVAAFPQLIIRVMMNLIQSSPLSLPTFPCVVGGVLLGSVLQRSDPEAFYKYRGRFVPAPLAQW